MHDTPAMPSKKAPHPIDAHVGNRVRLRRMLMGMSQEKLGDALGLTFQQVQKYEKGVNRIGASRLYMMSRILEVPIQFFYEDYGPDSPDAHGFAEAGGSKNEDQPVLDFIGSPEGVQLCRHFAKISDQQVRRRVLDLIRSIAEEQEARVDS